MSELLLVTAALLGLLAFYEPCTIATHTLFSVRVYRQFGTGIPAQVLQLWLVRSGFLSGLLLLAVSLSSPFDWDGYVPSLILAVIATVYIVSRFVYLPVPHLQVYRLLPGAARLPDSLHLGLSLPACTLPLFAIVIGMSIQVDSLVFAALAGLLFSSLFTLPVLLTSRRELDKKDQLKLAQLATVTPFFTAALLYVAVCPFCTPALLVLLTASASHGSVGFGFLLLLAFALGRSVPVILGAWSMGWLESLRFLRQRQKVFEIIAGTILILSGLYLINEYFLLVEIWI